MSEQLLVYDALKTHFRFKYDRHRGDFGVEIETETKKEYEYPQSRVWKCTRDGSLRDFGVEYILKAPLNRKEMVPALDEFETFDKEYKFVKDSISTSVHVHLNFLNENFLTVANFIATYALVENFLIKFSGPDRLSNLFCIPFRDAEGGVDKICHMLGTIARNNYKGAMLDPNAVKYGALNPAPLFTLGTLEVRSFRGETNKDLILQWIDILACVKKYAKKEGMTPMEVCNQYKSRGVKILNDIFGTLSGELVKGMTPEDISKLLRSNIWYSAKIANSTKDWSKFGIIKVKKVYKAKLTGELDAIARQVFSGAENFENLDYGHRMVVMERYLRMNPDVRVIDAEEDI